MSTYIKKVQSFGKLPVATLSTVGCAVGSLFCGPISKQLGRKQALFAVNLPLSASWVLLALSITKWNIFIACFLLGMFSAITFVNSGKS